MTRRLTLIGLTLAGAAMVLPAAAPASPPGGPGIAPVKQAEEVIVRFRSDADAQERADARRAADVERESGLPVRGLEVVDPQPGSTVREAIDALERSPDVLYAEPDVPRQAFVRPDDPLFDFQWALESTGQTVAGRGGAVDADVDASDAWEVTADADTVPVAVVDTGVDLSHPDLAPNLWRNRFEVSGNGRDDDGDGFVDDVYGWDFVGGDAQPLDEHGHGTHVAGTIGARGNDGYGVTGMAWNAAIIAVRALGADGTGTASNLLAAYRYAVRVGARVVNASLGGPGSSRAEHDVLAGASNTLFVVAAGNDAADVDSRPTYPCAYDLPNVVCVAATDRNDRLADFSNRGATAVDLAAPGVDVASTWPGGRHVLLSGTSMATPHVAAAAALAFNAAPSLTAGQVAALLRSTADHLPALEGLVAGAGRLNAGRLLATAAPLLAPPAGGTDAGEPPADEPDDGPEDTTEPIAPTAPSRSVDRIPPGLALGVPRRRALDAVLRRGLGVNVRCSEACTVRLEVVADDSGPGATLGHGATRLAAARSTTVTVTPTVVGRRRLRGAVPAVRVRAVARDAAGNPRTRLSRRVDIARR